MSGTMTETPFNLTEAVRNLVTADDEPVDNILSEKQQRLLVDALYESWTPPPPEDEEDVLRVYEIGFGKRYRRREDYHLPEAGLSLTLWEGRFEDSDNRWLRWLDAHGNLILTGHERAAHETAARRQAEDRAVQAEDRAARLAAKLRELGVEPE